MRPRPEEQYYAGIVAVAMFFRISPRIFELFPQVRIGVVSSHGLDNRGDSTEIQALLRQAEERLIGSFEGMTPASHPHIVPWREAYRKFGAKPKKHLSSIENLARRTLKGEKTRHINKLVDIYNAVSLRYIIPTGGEDLSRIVGNIHLAVAEEDESPVKLLGENEAHPPRAGEIIYKDDVGAICRRWNWKEADRTKLTEQTTRAILVIESLPPSTLKQLEAALSELSDWVTRFCGGTTTTAVLEKDAPALELASPRAEPLEREQR